jgi:hypothetical protein
MSAPGTSLLALLLLGVVVAPPSAAGPKPKKPKLEVRVAPGLGTAPLEVTAFISLLGGDDLEEFYCPEIELDWDDGAKSLQAPDCAPFEPGTPLTRHFSAGHLYRRGGYFEVRVRLRRAGRTIATAEGQARIAAGAGEFLY